MPILSVIKMGTRPRIALNPDRSALAPHHEHLRGEELTKLHI